MTFPGSRREVFKNPEVLIFENNRVIYGCCRNNCTVELLSEYFNVEFRELRQVHSNTIFDWKNIGNAREGDGIFVTSPGEGAIIKTADCVPLFFYSKSLDIAGIVHSGWRGFFSGIEKKTVELIKGLKKDIKDVSFIAGPHIEGKCYEVGPDLYAKFPKNPKRDNFFIQRGEKFFLDIFEGLKLSLIEEGVQQKNISNMKLCTFCSSENFPSYRKDNTKQRIYNFIFFK